MDKKIKLINQKLNKITNKKNYYKIKNKLQWYKNKNKLKNR